MSARVPLTWPEPPGVPRPADLADRVGRRIDLYHLRGETDMRFFRRAPSGPGRTTPAEADCRVRAGEAVLLDVRERPEWNAGHAPGAVHLPLSRLLAGAPLPASAEGRPVVAVCRSGHRSRQAARILAAKGYEAVDVKGGMIAWTREGLPVAGRGAGPSGAGPAGSPVPPASPASPGPSGPCEPSGSSGSSGSFGPQGSAGPQGSSGSSGLPGSSGDGGPGPGSPA